MQARGFLFAFLFGAAGCASAESCPAEVRISFPNFEIYPFILGSDNIEAKPGQLVNWVQEALRRSPCKPKVKLERLPPNRQIAEMKMGRIDMLPGFSFTEDLAADMAFPLRAGKINNDMTVIDDSSSLYVRADEQGVIWDGNKLFVKDMRVGSSTGGTSAEVAARERGWTLEMAATPQADLKKLIARRVDVILEPDRVLAPHLTGTDGKAVRKLEPAAYSTLRFVPVRKDFAAKYPEFTQRFWTDVCKQARVNYPRLPACK